jgi:hypothetical protein
MTQLERHHRPLSPSEKRLLSTRAAELRSLADAPRKVVLVAGGVCGALWILSLLATDDPWWVITLVWIGVGALIGFWVWRNAERDAVYVRDMARGLHSALDRDEADVFDFHSRAYIEFEEVEDEGACYGFDLGDGTVAFVVGQEYYPQARFPSLDFSLVYPLDTDDNAVHMLIEKRGPRAKPVRVVSRDVKCELEIPEHLSIVRAPLHRIEEVLRSR